MQFRYYTFPLLTALLFSGCGGSSSDTPTEEPVTPPIETSNEINITDESYQVVPLATPGETEISTTISVITQTPKDLYLVVSNYSTTDRASFTISQTAKISSIPKETKTVPSSRQRNASRSTPEIMAFNQHLITSPKTVSSKDTKVVLTKNSSVEGDSRRFYLDVYSSGSTTNATLRKVVSDVTTKFGNKTLNIWVSNDSFDSGSGCSKKTCVTQDMVDALAVAFLTDGTTNDIYDWVTNIYGEEWNAQAKDKYGTLIDETGEVTILLTDIDEDDSPNGGVIGYFWSKDNYTQDELSGSNEEIMFYIDSVMFANGDDGWDIEDYWPKETISTLAHEFQHMIHFFQKTILQTNGTGTDTWLNEMLSETIEDVIATKIEHSGPRGVIPYDDGSAGDPDNPNGRYPDFNANNTRSLTEFAGDLPAYAKVNAFGAYLTRNYGVEVLHDIMQNPYVHEDAVEYAVQQTPQGEGKNFNDLLKEWGIAVMLSDHTDLVDTPIYNTGDFVESSYDGITYDLGSINFFNYDPQPTIYTEGGTVQPQGNYYYKIGENISGKVDINITLNGTTEATLIAK
jgi:hypothetical protein